MGEFDQLVHKLAIEAAQNILAEEKEFPGSQESVNLEAARELLAGEICPIQQPSGLSVQVKMGAT